MKRLKNKLLNLAPNDITYSAMYEGSMNVVDGEMPPDTLYDSTYWRDGIGYEITRTNKLALDKPSVTIVIPVDYLLNAIKGESFVKRLLHYLLNMESNASTYKFALDNPTVTVQIPAENTLINAYTEASADYCLRAFKPYIDELNAQNYNRSRPDKENGKFYINAPDGAVLKRNSSYFQLVNQKYYENGGGNTVYAYPDDKENPPKMCLCMMIQVQLPQKKMRKTIQMLTKDLPNAVERFLTDFDVSELEKSLELAHKQASIREWLQSSDYCAFIANGCILPRSKGSDLPLENAVPFKSTSVDEIEVCGVLGMGIRRGVTVITGGGYSGKSTLLDAISAGIYNHIAGDGRELVITDETAVKISAEDGRSVKSLNISPFIKWLPCGDTANFSTEHASGSTSQAANIMEAVSYGTKLLLIDEDKSANNFMIRDRMMKRLIEKEPITPFTDRVNELYRDNDVSTILVIGGSGEYLSVADRIYMMQDYMISDVTEAAKAICEQTPSVTNPPRKADWNQRRTLHSEHFSSYPENSGSELLHVSDMGFIFIGDERIDIRMLHNVVSRAQLNAIAFILRHIEITNDQNEFDIEKKVDDLLHKLEYDQLDRIFSSFFIDCERWLDMPRKNEILAVVDRMRNIRFSVR